MISFMTSKNSITMPPEEFIDKLLYSDTDAIALITAAWRAGAQSQRAKDTASMVADYATSAAALMKKIERVRTVIRNTINKHWVATPADFKWTNGREGFIIGGIQRNNGTSYSQRWADITLDIANGKTEFTDADVIVLRGAGYYNSGLSVRFPAAWFRMSDGDLSKMVRKQIREAAKAQALADRQALVKMKTNLEKQLAKVTAQIESQG